MSRLKKCFNRLRNENRKGLISFITAGDPTIAMTSDIMHALVRGGADIIELGVPFSDPMADGEVIQRASERALSHGTSLSDVIGCVTEFRRVDADTPVILMGYLNPFERMGAAQFAQTAGAGGVDGALVVDLPPEEAAQFNADLIAAGLDQIFLVAPNSPEQRIRKVCSFASGFVYFVSIKGVTGGRSVAVDEIRKAIELTREIAGLPVGIGFGIRTPEAAAEAAAIADAIVVGSAIVELIEIGGNSSEVCARVEQYLGSLRQAIDHRAVSA